MVVNPYSSAPSRTIMVEIQCPHCDEDIELEDGSYGLFDCPHCGDEFEWNGDFETDDLKVGFLLFLFGTFSPSLLFFVSLWIMVAVVPPSGWDVLLYFGLSIIFCVSYTLSLAIYSGLTKNKPLLQGILLSVLASAMIIYMYTEVL